MCSRHICMPGVGMQIDGCFEGGKDRGLACVNFFMIVFGFLSIFFWISSIKCVVVIFAGMQIDGCFEGGKDRGSVRQVTAAYRSRHGRVIKLNIGRGLAWKAFSKHLGR